MSKKRVAWFSIHPTHYNNFLFEALEKSLPLELELFFCNKVLSMYTWKSKIHSGIKDYYFNKIGSIDWSIIALFAVNKGNFDFCNAVLEAMACGLIVIGSDTTGAVKVEYNIGAIGKLLF